MALTFAQYQSLFDDTTLAPKIKTFASRLLRDFYKANPTKENEFLRGLELLNSTGFVERVRVELLGELDDAGIALPTATDLAAATRAALRNALKNPTL